MLLFIAEVIIEWLFLRGNHCVAMVMGDHWLLWRWTYGHRYVLLYHLLKWLTLSLWRLHLVSNTSSHNTLYLIKSWLQNNVGGCHYGERTTAVLVWWWATTVLIWYTMLLWGRDCQCFTLSLWRLHLVSKTARHNTLYLIKWGLQNSLQNDVKECRYGEKTTTVLLGELVHIVW